LKNLFSEQNYFNCIEHYGQIPTKISDLRNNFITFISSTMGVVYTYKILDTLSARSL